MAGNADPALGKHQVGIELITQASSSDEAQRRYLGHAKVAVLPIGSYEQHGTHLPMNTDTLIARIISSEIAHKYNLFLLEAIAYGTSHEHGDYPGTISVTESILTSQVEAIRECLLQDGINKLVIVNCHGGNYFESYATVVNLQERKRSETPAVLLYPDSASRHNAQNKTQCTPGDLDMHAGDFETSILLAYLPHLVRDSYLHADFDQPNWQQNLHLVGMKGLTPTGVIGKPSKATAARGKELVASLVADFASRLELLTHPKPQDLDARLT